MAASEAPIYAARTIRSRSVRTERIVLLATPDSALRTRISSTLSGLRWEVGEVSGGAELFSLMETLQAGTIVLDSWLPDLDVTECARELAGLYPGADILAIDGTDFGVQAAEGAYRNEVLHALSRAQQADEAAWETAPSEAEILRNRKQPVPAPRDEPMQEPMREPMHEPVHEPVQSRTGASVAGQPRSFRSVPGLGRAVTTLTVRGSKALGSLRAEALPELLGTDPRMLEVARRIRLVAPRSTAVLVQGPTGTGKELVARALHRFSTRATRPFVALNCAAIPEALLEAELFGHTRGAFTGAVQGRVGRLEAAHGGTLFLDEIGELPLALQAKLLRFVECGELQRVGENEPVHVDVRIIAATHRKLGQMAAAGTFRPDLYYRLSVFLIQTPALAGRAADITLLAAEALKRMAGQGRTKSLAPEAMLQLLGYAWPGNVRELEHTLERAWILSEESAVISADDIDFGEAVDA